MVLDSSKLSYFLRLDYFMSKSKKIYAQKIPIIHIHLLTFVYNIPKDIRGIANSDVGENNTVIIVIVLPYRVQPDHS